MRKDPGPIKRLVAYARVSTEDQRETGYSLEFQIVACREWVSRNDGYVISHVIQEDFTGTVLDRPGLVEALGLLETGAAEGIICYSADRFSRSLQHRAILREEVQALRAELIFTKTGVVGTDATAILLDNVHGAFSQFELDVIRERTMAGRVQKAMNGIPGSGGTDPFGYVVSGKGRNTEFLIEPTEAAIVQRIFKLYTEDSLSGRDIAIQLNSDGIASRNQHRLKRGAGYSMPDTQFIGFSPAAVYFVLRNEIYTGHWYFNRTRMELVGGKKKQVDRPRNEWIEVQIPRIISDETYLLASRRRNSHQRFSVRTPSTSVENDGLLKGRIACVCGRSNFVRSAKNGGHKGGVKHYYYQCTAKDRANHTPCSMPAVKRDNVDPIVWDWVTAQMVNMDRIREVVDYIAENASQEAGYFETKIGDLEREIARNREKIGRLVDLYASGNVPVDVLNSTVYKLKQEEERLQQQVDEYKRERVVQIADVPDADVVVTFIKAVRARLPNLDSASKKEVVRALGVRAFRDIDVYGRQMVRVSSFVGSADFVIGGAFG